MLYDLRCELLFNFLCPSYYRCTEGTEEDDEDEEKSYDSRNLSRRSSQQELGNSDDSQATEPLRHSQLEVIRGLQSQPVEDVEGDSDADTNVPIRCPLITSAVHSAVAAVIPQAGQVVHDGPFFTNTELQEMTREFYSGGDSDSGEDSDWSIALTAIRRASYVHAPPA